MTSLQIPLTEASAQLSVGMAQLNPTIGDLPGNAQQILQAAQQAASQGVRLLLTPELSLCGYPPRDLLMQPSFVQAMSETLHQLAQDLPPQLAVLIGTVETNGRSHQGEKSLFNCTVLIESGKIQQRFHKRLLPTYDVFDESRYFQPGLQSNAFLLKLDSSQTDSPTIRVGVTICEDLWNDEEFWGKRQYQVNPIADLAEQGVDLIVNLSASPYSAEKQALREAMLQHSAKRFHQPILYVNQVGGNDDLIFDGNSVGFNCAGDLVARAASYQPDLVCVDFDLQERDLCSGLISPLPTTTDEEIWLALVLGVRDYARKCGFSKVVLGLSGGIDSALVAAIATEALGASNVLGVLMPSPYSSDHSVSDALKLAKNLGIKTEVLAIGTLMAAYDETLAHLFAGTEFGVTEENLQSRIRGNLLMAIANKFGYLLLSTGNKSEMAVGYCTLYGDMNGGLAAIADVPKTRVYSLCNWLNTQPDRIGRPDCDIIPRHIITKPPSAELKPNQVDQDSLPPYDQLDDILDRLLTQHQSPAEILAAGHEQSHLDRVIKLVLRAEFKRKQAPPGLKVTDRAFGTGWRMPIAQRWRMM